VLRRSFWIRTFQILTVLFFAAMIACIIVGKITDDLQSSLWGITFMQWLWIAIAFLPLYCGSLIAALELSKRKNDTSPQEESS